MPGPVETLLLLLAWGAGVVLLLWREVRAAPPGAEAEHRARALTWAILASLLAAPLTFGLALAVSQAPLPVKPPGEPSGCGETSSGGSAGIVVTAILILVAVRLLPALIGYLLGRRTVPARGVPDGQRALRIGAALLGGLAVLALIRVALGGVPEAAFTTYGAVTPPGASGRRVDATIARHLADGQRFALGQAPAIETDVRPTHGHLRLTSGPLEVDGLKAFVAGQPVNLVVGDQGRLLVQAVRSSGLDPARRPRWAAPPWWGRSPGDGLRLLVGPAEGGGRLAVRVAVSGTYVRAVGAMRSDVGLLLRPPALPLVLALLLAALALGLRARARSHDAGTTARDAAWAGVCRLGAAAVLLEASLLLLGAYRIFF